MNLNCRTARELPASLSAGDSWAWTVVLDSSVAAGSTLVYSFRAKDGSTGVLTVSGTRATDGLSFALTATANQTGVLKSGPYSFIARLTTSPTVSTIRSGTLKVTPNLADLTAETRSQAEIDLAAVQATLRSIQKRTNGSFSGGGVSYTTAQIAELRNELYRLQRAVDAEQGKSGAVTIRTAFGRRCGWAGVDDYYR